MTPLLLIQTGHPPQEIIKKHGDYDVWFKNSFKQDMTRIVVFDGEELPSVNDIETKFSGIVITGSPSMVSDEEPWSVATANILRELVLRGNIPILGVCYGHQLLGYAMGGYVNNNPNGPSFGSMTVKVDQERCLDDPLFSIFSSYSEYTVHVSHLQTVIVLPKSSVSLIQSPKDPNHAVRFGGKAWGVQYHPEFSYEISRSHVTMREGIIEANEYRKILNSMHDCYITNDSLIKRFVSLTKQTRL